LFEFSFFLDIFRTHPSKHKKLKLGKIYIMALILGIETSCDETAAAVVSDGADVKSNVVSSQIARHAVFGGVVPELAAREHLSGISTVTDCALREAGVSISDISAIAVTNGPGLVPALLIGVNFARSLALKRGLPLIPVNHFAAHIYGSFLGGKTAMLNDPKTYPLLALVVSGGHTVLLLIKSDSSVSIIGQTLDDAAGEAFDKGAKILGLGYPGGPLIQKASKDGNPAKFAFPRALTGASGRAVSEDDRFNFSFSGLKTALLNHVRNSWSQIDDKSFISDSAASYQEAIVDVLFRKTSDAADFYSVSTVVICGGVACNSRLREKFACGKFSNMIAAEPRYCTDNAAMIAATAFHSPDIGHDYWIDVFPRIGNMESLKFVKTKHVH